MKNKFGQTLQLNDIVVYPVRIGSRLTVKKGTIVKINPDKNTIMLEVEENSERQLTTVQNPERVCVISRVQQVKFY